MRKPLPSESSGCRRHRRSYFAIEIIRLYVHKESGQSKQEDIKKIYMRFFFHEVFVCALLLIF